MTNLTKQKNRMEWHKYDRNSYKLNAKDCGPDMYILENGFVATHSGLLYNGKTLLKLKFKKNIFRMEFRSWNFANSYIKFVGHR